MRLRQATRDDTAEIWRVRYAVTENRLTPGRIGDAELHAHLEDFGRGWVVELEPAPNPRIAGFAIGDARDGHIWAMFVDPPLHGQGYGRLLHDEMVRWLFAQGHRRLDLGTEPGSRAEAFYRRAGWRPLGNATDAHGDRLFELRLEDWTPHA
ncbi:GNAT family N-acetyltransferase [Roseateles cellulosilyticus]|uniref:GNAT family N-acetyltransferase n=1 Tax=Pelomonas cellulosilytica TaxID=2906762 RepID=A0ABS8XZA5_9BURK|nr:GNAT family N-acetyltransferase [Pelomonas sp. P8]MCE4557182.1 GNAT family N-acetyltransferase [Pelomonas sp. P8]